MRGWITLACALVVALLCTASAVPAAGSKHIYEVYTAKVDRDQARDIARAGYDVVADRQTAAGVELDLVLSSAERARLAGQGVRLDLKRLKNGLTLQEFAAAQAADGFEVWRSWDEAGGIRDELYTIAQRNPLTTKLEVIGHSVQGREIIALKVTRNARTLADGSRPAALYNSLQHAREWISVEVNRRLLHYFVDNYGSNAEVTNLVNTRELWFVLVANPDGYQYTFDTERNWPEHWNWDNEGSASLVSDETYRGTGPNSEPETQALKGLLDRLQFKYMVNYHSAAQQLLLPFGWQESTPSPDNPIFIATSGTDHNPAIPGFDVGLSSDELYITNGETTDYAYAADKTLAVTPELSEGCDGCGFEFPDDETLVQEEFERIRPHAVNVARSVTDLTNPVSNLGVTLAPFYTHQDQLDPQMSNMPLTDFRFAYSYGDPQPVRVLARRNLGAVSLEYQINGGTWQTTTTAEWTGGDRWGEVRGVYYHIVGGTITGTHPGDTVTVQFKDSDGPATSEPFTYGH